MKVLEKGGSCSVLVQGRTLMILIGPYYNSHFCFWSLLLGGSKEVGLWAVLALAVSMIWRG